MLGLINQHPDKRLTSLPELGESVYSLQHDLTILSGFRRPHLRMRVLFNYDHARVRSAAQLPRTRVLSLIK